MNFSLNPQEDIFLIFSVILLIAFVIPEFFSRLKVAYIPFYIFAGMLIGPHGFLKIEVTEPLQFVGDLGLLLLVFLAGLEIHAMVERSLRSSLLMSMIFGAVCFAGGYLLGLLFGQPPVTNFLLGAVLMSSSVAEIVSIVNSAPALKKSYGHVIVPAIVILDTSSLVLLGIMLKYKTAPGELYLFFVEITLFLLLVFYLIPHLVKRYFQRRTRKPRESDMKFVFLTLIAVVALSELIGLHGIVAAFIVGVALGEFIPRGPLYEKLHGLGHGLLIPVFFIVLGMSLDTTILIEGHTSLLFLISLIVTLVCVKVASGVIYSKMKKGGVRDGVILGVTFWPQMSATLAAASIGYRYGIFNETVLLAIVFMSIFSIMTSPFAVRYLTRDRTTSVLQQNHTVVVGYGRTSSKIVTILDFAGKDVAVIEKDLNKVRRLEERGIRVIYGSGTDQEALRKAGISGAKVALITIPDEHEVYLTARYIRELNPDCYTIAKIHTEKLLKRLKKEGLVDSIIWPEKMSSLEATRKVFEHLEGFYPEF
ncbi:hypothetical protein B6U83_00885 [Thermoplasmatales archaeon ex4484_36]|nr:MAG: hypothetical protein B6U83_00885 [Thermoplasmatales archaeon ex4484_36]RLF53485.1 MAG: hypothetical protein DRN28_06990 [Thermoplasmata archaeon]RLF68538.1 MAG: hypothetical protein DRN40_07475 [Thermoplasmata archaeon]